MSGQELATNATHIRRIVQEGLFKEELERQRKQQAFMSWGYFVGGVGVVIAGLVASVLIAQETGHGALVDSYNRYELMKDTLWSYGSLGFGGAAALDSPFLPENVARACIHTNETSWHSSYYYDQEIPVLEGLLSEVEYLHSEAEQGYTLSRRRLEIIPVCKDLRAEEAQLIVRRDGVTRCSVSLGRAACRDAEALYTGLVADLATTHELLSGCNKTEGLLVVLHRRGLLPQHAILLGNYNRTAEFLEAHVRSNIPYNNLTLEYVESTLESFAVMLYTNISHSVLIDEAVNYYKNHIAYSYLSMIKTLLSSHISSYHSLKETHSQLNRRHSREEHYARARTRLSAELALCVEQDSSSLVCRELQRNYARTEGWIEKMERFQLSVPANFFDMAFEALLTPELIPVCSVRDFQRFKKVEYFKTHPSTSFLVLTGVVGIGAFILIKLVCFDFLSVYLNLLILPGEYMNIRMRYSIEELKMRQLAPAPAQPLLTAGSNS